MKPRYNLRIQPNQALISTTNKGTSSRVTKKPTLRPSTTINDKQSRRHSLRLTPLVKPSKPRPETIPKWRKVENDTIEENTSINDDAEDDDYDELVARHHRRMLEEQKDRKLYERYVRGQRTLRRLQCRRTHTAHLNETTRSRLLRELERERRYTVQDQICAYLADHTILFRHGCHLNSNQAMDWSTLEDEIPRKKHIDTIHQLDVMINNLKKVIRTSKSSTSKPRLSVHERQKQRLGTTAMKPTAPTILANSEILQSNEIKSTMPTITSIPQPIVRFVDEQNNKLRTTNLQHLTCIQNVLLQNNNNNNHQHHHHSRIATNDLSTPVGIRKQFLRPKYTHINFADSSQTKKRPLEKENCSLVTSTSNNHLNSNVALRATSSMVPMKPHISSSSSYRPYPNTRKHPININLSTTRRQTRLSANV